MEVDSEYPLILLGELVESADTLLADNQLRGSQRIMWETLRQRGVLPRFPQSQTRILHLCVAFGLHRYVNLRLDSDREESKLLLSSMLQVALKRFDPTMVEILLEKHDDLDEKIKDFHDGNWKLFIESIREKSCDLGMIPGRWPGATCDGDN